MSEKIVAYDGHMEHWYTGEEIVRCRDCSKWSFFDVVDDVRFGDCSEFAHLDGFGHATDENGFCAWGEKRKRRESE